MPHACARRIQQLDSHMDDVTVMLDQIFLAYALERQRRLKESNTRLTLRERLGKRSARKGLRWSCGQAGTCDLSIRGQLLSACVTRPTSAGSAKPLRIAFRRVPLRMIVAGRFPTADGAADAAHHLSGRLTCHSISVRAYFSERPGESRIPMSFSGRHGEFTATRQQARHASAFKKQQSSFRQPE